MDFGITIMKRFWNWLKPPKRRLLLIRRFSTRVRLEEFRAIPELVATAKKFLNDPEFQPLLEVLRNESPASYVSIDPMLPLDARAVLQARIEGYQLAINNLMAMGEHKKAAEELEAGYEQPENDMP